MNAPLILLLVCILAAWAVSTLADLLNARRLSPTPPPGLEDIYDPQEYARSQDYTSARTRLNVCAETTLTLVTVIFLLVGGLPLADGLARSAAQNLLQSPPGQDILAGLFFLGGLGLFASLLNLPFAALNTFSLEERFGFNRTTARTFILDQGKGLLLSVLFGGPLLAGVLWLLHAYGPEAWIGCWILVAVVLFLIRYLAPLLLPLFFSFTPLEQSPLRRDIETMAHKLGFPLTELYKVDGSRRSSKGNAFFTGIGNNRRIALFDTLLDQMDDEEILAILGHELGHWKLRHSRRTFVITLGKLGVLFWLFSLLLGQSGLFASLGLEPSPHAGLLLFFWLFSPISLLFGLLDTSISRKHEFEADRFAARLTGNPHALIQGLRKLARQHLANLTQHPLLVALTYSHPPLGQRLAALHDIRSTLNKPHGTQQTTARKP